jgi:2,3-bisphosphoglycerate-independent phosphoglycerate mutase
MSENRPKPVVLCILDGWGHREATDHNAVALAHGVNWARLIKECPWSLVDASELHVGLPTGQMGNSEVGHMNLGAGRVVMQDLPRIDTAISSGEVAQMPALRDFIGKLKQSGGACHLLGLLSPGGVHSHQDQMAAVAKIVAAAGVPVFVHGFLDGRDTPPSSAKGFIADFAAKVSSEKTIRFGTIGGRYYGMDRDKRWERVELAYNAFFGEAPYTAKDALSAVDAGYARGETDEFVKPTAIEGFPGIKNGDGLFMANFRADRARQTLTALIDPAFTDFQRKHLASFAAILGMVEYSAALAKLMPCLFPPFEMTHTLGQVIAEAGLKQLRIAETEKYAHVTFFFNGGEESLFPGEDRIMVPSPKVATYDLKPEMSAFEVTDKLVDAIEAKKFDLIVVNYANSDMVGHTGDLEAAKKAVLAVDACLGRLRAAVEKQGGILLVTADHGNAEQMEDLITHEPHTAHTLNRVPFIIVNGPGNVRKVEDGKLSDVAPTILELMHLPQPKEMTGRSLIRREAEDIQRRARN